MMISPNATSIWTQVTKLADPPRQFYFQSRNTTLSSQRIRKLEFAVGKQNLVQKNDTETADPIERDDRRNCPGIRRTIDSVLILARGPWQNVHPRHPRRQCRRGDRGVAAGEL